jgi:DNA-binding transcriptional MerR regulator
MKSTVRIGAAATRFGLAAHVLRCWESVGLLTPTRDSAGRRFYARGDLRRIATITNAKRVGLSLTDIRAMLAGGPAHRAEILDRRRAELTERIRRNQETLALIDCATGCTHDDLESCPHLTI